MDQNITDEDRVRDELDAVKAAPEKLTGLRFRWSGNVIPRLFAYRVGKLR